MLIPTLQTNDTFKNALTIDEGRVFDAVKSSDGLTGAELSEKLQLPAALINTLYSRALDKFLKYATRSEM